MILFRDTLLEIRKKSIYVFLVLRVALKNNVKVNVWVVDVH